MYMRKICSASSSYTASVTTQPAVSTRRPKQEKETKCRGLILWVNLLRATPASHITVSVALRVTQLRMELARNAQEGSRRWENRMSSGSWFWPGPGMAGVAIWEETKNSTIPVNLWMIDFCLRALPTNK